ncbi:MAG: YlbF family regulator [Lachnospiraceae bacterium]|nr:YlbF family regulator [Lachnospiraceae bacterium]
MEQPATEEDVNRVTEQILDIIKKTETYNTYLFYSRRLKNNFPALYERMKVFAKEARELANAPESEIMDRTDAFREKYDDFLDKEAVDCFMRSEMALVRMVQKVSTRVVNAMGIENFLSDDGDGGDSSS